VALKMAGICLSDVTAARVRRPATTWPSSATPPPRR